MTAPEDNVANIRQMHRVKLHLGGSADLPDFGAGMQVNCWLSIPSSRLKGETLTRDLAGEGKRVQNEAREAAPDWDGAVIGR